MKPLHTIAVLPLVGLSCDTYIDFARPPTTCEPNSIVECYTGPSGTETQGICRPGTMICNAEGSGYGPCIDEVTPQTENCQTAEDEDCNGDPSPCTGNVIWSKRFGDAEDQRATGIAVDHSGNIIITGYFGGTINFGNGILVSAGSSDIFVAKFSPEGDALWSKRFGDSAEQVSTGVAVDDNDHVLLTGYFGGEIDFGGTTLSSADGSLDVDIFVAKLDPEGNHLGSKRFGDLGDQHSAAIAVDAAGNIFVTGRFSNKSGFGGTSAGGQDAFIVKMDDSIDLLWSLHAGDAEDQSGASVSTDTDGNCVVTGAFAGTMPLGSTPLLSQGGQDIYVAKVDDTGTTRWSQDFGDALDFQRGTDVTVDAGNHVVLGGRYYGTVDFGGGALTSAGAEDIFVTKLDTAGAHIWSRRFGDAGFDVLYALAIDGANSILLTGNFTGAIDFGGGAMPSAGSQDIYLAKLDEAGGHIWSKRFGDVSDAQTGVDVATDGTGNVVLVGSFNGNVDFGNGVLGSAGGSDVFLAKFAP